MSRDDGDTQRAAVPSRWPASPAEHTLLALAPCLLVAALVHGPGVLRALVVVTTCAWLVERTTCTDVARPFSAAGRHVAAAVIAFALPPATPLLVCITGGCMLGLLHWANRGPAAQPAVVPGNAAMIVVAVLLVAGAPWLPPWPALPLPVDDWLPQLLGQPIDGTTGATLLQAMSQRAPATMGEWAAATGQLGVVGPVGSEWIAIGWAVAGGYLVWRRVLSIAPIVACCGGVLITASLLYQGDGSDGGLPPLTHLFGGGTLLIATVVLAEPTNAARTAAARLAIALLVGVLLVLARHWGGGIDRGAAIVLLAGLLAPSVDAWWLRQRRVAA